MLAGVVTEKDSCTGLEEPGLALVLMILLACALSLARSLHHSSICREMSSSLGLCLTVDWAGTAGTAAFFSMPGCKRWILRGASPATADGSEPRRAGLGGL